MLNLNDLLWNRLILFFFSVFIFVLVIKWSNIVKHFINFWWIFFYFRHVKIKCVRFMAKSSFRKSNLIWQSKKYQEHCKFTAIWWSFRGVLLFFWIEYQKILIFYQKQILRMHIYSHIFSPKQDSRNTKIPFQIIRCIL